MNRGALLRYAFSIMTLLNASLTYAQFTVTPIGHSTPNFPNIPIYLDGIVQSGAYAYTPNGNFGGLVIYDISNPTNPTNVGKATVGSAYAYDLALAGTKAFVAGDNTGLEIYDVSDPANIVSLSHTNNGGSPGGVTVSGAYAYLASGGLWIYDISNPTSPINVGHATNWVMGVAVSGNYAYGAAWSQGLTVFDISNPSNPVSIAQTNIGVPVRDIKVSGKYAYLQSSDGFRIYDISNPASPLYVGQNPTNYGASTARLTVSGNFVYLANGADGFRIWDVSDPSSPVEAGHGQNTNSIAPVIGVAVSGDYAYAASGGYGLSVFKLSGPQLQVDLTNTNTAVLSWLTNTLNFRLQQTSNLIAGWINVTNISNVVGNRNLVILSPRNTTDFYRLKLH